MSSKTYILEGAEQPSSQIGLTIETLADIILSRTSKGEESYTYRLLNGNEDEILKKIIEEAGETALAAKDDDVDHLRYEAADVVFHLLVLLKKYGISLDEFAAELNQRMTDEERPDGAIRLHDQYVNRGK